MESFNHIMLQGTNTIARKENITELFLQKLWLGWGVLKKSKINAEKFSRGIFWTQNRNLLHCWGWYVSCGDAHTSVKVCMHSGHNKENILTFLWNPELFFKLTFRNTYLFKRNPAPLTHRSKNVMSLTGAHWHPTNILIQKCYFTHFFKMFRFYMKWVFGSEPLSPRDDKDLRIICHSLSKSTTGERT